MSNDLFKMPEVPPQPTNQSLLNKLCEIEEHLSILIILNLWGRQELLGEISGDQGKKQVLKIAKKYLYDNDKK